jgi:hypothetical protein
MKINLALVAAALTLTSTIASAADPPALKEGLWSIHSQTINNPGGKKSDNSSTICRSHAYDQHALDAVRGMKDCAIIKESAQAGSYSIQMHCVAAGTAIDSTATVTTTSEMVSHSETHATYNPALGGISETTLIQDQKYLGSCPAGTHPGDLTQADGTLVHLGDH